MPGMNERTPVSGLVPMIHVADVEASAAFYRHLGFEIGNQVPKTGNRNGRGCTRPVRPTGAAART
jgi:catechol 2,3-dioxygenase-like lactoylglutathione lyase family enzyme